MGLGGVDGDFSDLDDDKDLVCSADEDVIKDFSDIIELHRDQEQQQHDKEVSELINDVTTGNLRKRMAKRHRNGQGGFDLMDSSDDDEALLRKLTKRAHQYGDYVHTESAEMSKFAANSETAAFAKCFENQDFEKKGFLSDSDHELKPLKARDVVHGLLKRRFVKKSDKENFHIEPISAEEYETNEIDEKNEYQNEENEEDNDELDKPMFSLNDFSKRKLCAIPQSSQSIHSNFPKTALETKLKQNATLNREEEKVEFGSSEVDVMHLIQKKKKPPVKVVKQSDFISAVVSNRFSAKKFKH